MEATLLKLYRNKALVLAYQVGMRHVAGAIELGHLAKELDLPKEDLTTVVNLLNHQGMLDWQHCPVGSIKLSSSGQSEAERLDPDEALRPLPPPPQPGVVINQVHNSPNSNILQGGHGANQTASGQWAPTALLDALAAISSNADKLGLAAAQIAELKEAVSEMQEAAKSGRPSLLRSLGRGLVSILSGAATPLAGQLAGLVTKAIVGLPPS